MCILLFRFAFLDIGPLSKGHSLVIPKCESDLTLMVPRLDYLLTRISDHGEKLGDVPDEYLTEILPAAKKIALAAGIPDYNILQVSLLVCWVSVKRNPHYIDIWHRIMAGLHTRSAHEPFLLIFESAEVIAGL